MQQISTKVDKEDLRKIQEDIINHGKRIEELEDNHRDAETKKQLVLNMGNMGIKFWGFLTTTIIFLMGAYKEFFNK